jgi:hypothetical protein
MRILFAVIVGNLVSLEEHSKARLSNRPPVVGILPTRERPILRAFRQGRAAYGAALETSTSLGTTVSGGLRPLLGPMPGTGPWTSTTASSTGTATAVPTVFRFVASEIKGGA